MSTVNTSGNIKMNQALLNLANILEQASNYEDSDNNVVNVELENGIFKLSIKTDGDSAYKLGPRSEAQIKANNDTRSRFMQTLEDAFGGTVPPEILNHKAMKHSDFTAGGRPLTTRRLNGIGKMLKQKLGIDFASIKGKDSANVQIAGAVVRYMQSSGAFKPGNTANFYLGDGDQAASKLTFGLIGSHKDSHMINNLLAKLLKRPKNLDDVKKSQLEELEKDSGYRQARQDYLKKFRAENPKSTETDDAILSKRFPKAYMHGTARTKDDLVTEFKTHARKVWDDVGQNLTERLSDDHKGVLKGLFDGVADYILEQIKNDPVVFAPETKEYEAMDRGLQSHLDNRYL